MLRRTVRWPTPVHRTLPRASASLLQLLPVPLVLLPLLLAPATASRSFARAASRPPPLPLRAARTAGGATISPESLPESTDQPYTTEDAMAWQCSGMTNQQLVDKLVANKLIRTRRVYNAMSAVDRGLFLPADTPPECAYQDAPQTLGWGATISAPHMHAMCLELLANHLQPGKRALDVGSGSGYLVAAFAAMMGAKQAAVQAAKVTATSAGEKAAAAADEMKQAPASTSSASISVYGIEHIQELVDTSHANLRRWDPDWKSFIRVFKGDGRQGVKGEQFAAIHVGAAAPTIPEPLLQQLAPGGRLVIPVGTADQQLICVDKDEHGKLTQHIVSGVRYVPLCDEDKQLEIAMAR